MIDLARRSLPCVAQLCTLALVLLCGVASLSWPLGWDQGVFAQIGDVINRGGLPYRDGWDLKGPLVYYLAAFSQALLGTNQWGIRAVDFALLLAGGWALAWTVASLTSTTAGRWTGLVFMLVYLAGGFWDAAQPDGWVALFLALGGGLLIVPTRRNDLPRLGIAGALVGLCALTKWLYVAYLLIPLTAAVWVTPRRGRILAARVVSVLTGFLIPTVACGAWFVAHGALDDLVEAHFRYGYEVYGQEFSATSLNLNARALGIAKFLTKPHVMAALPAIAIGMLALWRTAPRADVLLALWSTIALGCVTIQSRFVDYQWLPIYPPLAALCAVGLYALLDGSPGEHAIRHTERWRERTAVLAVCTAAVLTLYAAIHPAISVARWIPFLTGSKSADQYYDHFPYASPGMKAARYVREHTTAQDQVALWGSNSSILYLSRRTNPTRFGTYDPLVWGAGTHMRAAYREEYLRSIQRARPVYFVVSTQDLSETPVPQDLQSFPELLIFLTKNYRPEKAFAGGVTVYRRRDDVNREAHPSFKEGEPFVSRPRRGPTPR